MPNATPPMPSLALFAPVQRFVLDQAAVQTGILAGYAASQSNAQFASRNGARGCAVKLVSGTELFSIARAWAFSEQARDDGVQDGWAGFTIHGLSTAMALAPAVELRCAVSDRLLATLARSDLPVEITAPRPRHLDVRTLRSALRAVYGCSNLQHALPMAETYRDIHGPGALVEASYRWILRRNGAQAEMLEFIAGLEPGWVTLDIWERITASDEFRAGLGMPLLGPFEADFPFRA